MNTRRVRARVIVIFLMIGVVWLFVRGGWATGEDQMGIAGNDAEYVGNDPDFRLSFVYPEGWSLAEERGAIDAYREVRIRGPRNAEDTYTCYLAVRSSPLKAQGGKFTTVGEAIQHYTSHLLEGSTVESRTRRVVAGLSAEDLTVLYTLPPLHLHGLKPQAIPIKTRTVFVEQSPYLYEFSYSADAREFSRYAEAFERLVTTFRFNQ